MVYKLKNKIKTVGKTVGGLIAGAYISTLVGCTGVNNMSKYDSVNNNLDNKVKTEQIMDVYQLGKQKLNLSYSAVDDYISAFKTEIKRKNLNLNAEEQFKLFIDYTSNSKEAFMVLSDEKKGISDEQAKNKTVIRPKYILKTNNLKDDLKECNNSQKWFLYFYNISKNKRSEEIYKPVQINENKYGYVNSEIEEINNYFKNIWQPLSEASNCTAQKDINNLIMLNKSFKMLIKNEEYCKSRNKKNLEKQLKTHDYEKYLKICNNLDKSKKKLNSIFKNNFGLGDSCFKKSIIDKLENKIRSDFYKNKQPVKSIKEQLKKSKKYRR